MCQKHLGLSDAVMLDMYREGHVCGDMVDTVGGQPTGSVRISFGYMSSAGDVDVLISLIRENFVEDTSDDDQPEDALPDRGLVTVTALHVYPVKSCAGMNVKRCGGYIDILIKHSSTQMGDDGWRP